MGNTLILALLAVLFFTKISMARQRAKHSANEALKRLKDGNEKYLAAVTGIGDISPQVREKTSQEGQFPYAVVVTCSDSRVIPESIFSAGIGELFVIRAAGFVMGKFQLGSVEYAVEHLGVPLVVVMGHTQCGAVSTALSHEVVEGNLRAIIDEISEAIGDEQDSDEAVKLNVRHSCKAIENNNIHATVVGAVYHTDSGKVEFI